MRVALIGLVLLVAACSGNPSAPTDSASSPSPTTPDTSSEASPVPESFDGTAWSTQGEDGTTYVTFLDPGGKYRDLRDGELWQTGSWTFDVANENRICFTPDDRNGVERCWKPEKMHGKALDVIGGQDARRVELDPVDYLPPDATATGKPTAKGKKPA